MSLKITTRAGFVKLQEELNYLWLDKRPKITKIVSWAASLGDRSENADYHYNKKLLREIDRRVRYLQKLIPDIKIVDYSPEQEGKVYFGAWVEIESESGEFKRLRIVGYDEIFGMDGYISVESPMAKALLKKEVDDEVIVDTPSGSNVWFITKIEYLHHTE
ncbi:MAG: transcription elongation factor GreB [Cycloclasticus sp.]|nr:transcription elongation factor GreB [Cycloclasticus sp.]